MRYAGALQQMLSGFRPHTDHLYLLEPFQIDQLWDRLDSREIASLLALNPTLRRVWASKSPPFEARVAPILADIDGTGSDQDEVLWEIADLLAANAAPDLLDSRSDHADLAPILEAHPIRGLVVEAGAGTGRVALALARQARSVYAVEPVGALRSWIQAQAKRLGVPHLRVVDGFLHDLPFPDHTVDLLVTRGAIGWRIDEEIRDIDRILQPGGAAVHLTGLAMDQEPGDLHDRLVEAGYRLAPYRHANRWRRRYIR